MSKFLPMFPLDIFYYNAVAARFGFFKGVT